MPVTYELQGSLLKLSLEGRYEPRDVVAQFLAGLADPKCPGQVALLVDVTQSQSLETRSPHEIRLVAEQLGPHRERIGGRSAVVAATDGQFCLNRMWKGYTENVGAGADVCRRSRSQL